MFTLFINLIVFAVLYFMYFIFKNKAYQIRDNSHMRQDHEILIFPLALYIYFLFASSQFQTLGDSGISFFSFANLTHLKFIPFEDWVWQYDYTRFMRHVYADYNTWPISSSITFLQSFVFHLAYLTPIAFALKSIYHSRKKTLLIFLPITLLAGLQSYELNVGTIIVTAITAYIIGISLSDFVSLLISKKTNLKAKLHSIAIYTALLIPLALFLFNMNILSPQSYRIQNMNFTKQEPFVTFDHQVSLMPLEYRKENDTKLHIEFSVSNLPTLTLPYSYDLQSINYHFETDGVPLIIGSSPSQAASGQKEEVLMSSIHLDNIEYTDKFIEKNIYPVKFYGIDSIAYASKDPALLKQLEVIDTNWSHDVYDYYEITYRVPVLSQQEVKWQINVTYDNPLLKDTASKNIGNTFYNDVNSPTLSGYFDYPVLMSEDSTYKTYTLKCYFYLYGHGTFSKEEIKGIETSCWDVKFNLLPETKSDDPLWVIEADTLE